MKTAVAEATMNVMEHNNRYQPDVLVAIDVCVLKPRWLCGSPTKAASSRSPTQPHRI